MERQGNLVAVNASGRVEWNRSLGSATTTCPNTPDDVFGIGGTPVLDPVAGRLYVAVNDGASGHVFVYALDAATGKTVTGWPVSIDNDPLHMHVWGALTLWQGTLYVTTGGMCDIPPYWGRVIAIHTATPSIAASWSVVHVGDEVKQGGGIWGYGGAAVESRTGDVFVATGNALGPQPQDQPYAESVVRLDGTNLSVRAANAPSVEWRCGSTRSRPASSAAAGTAPSGGGSSTHSGFFPSQKITSGKPQRCRRCRSTWA